MPKNRVFKKRYVLGEGYPWAIGLKSYGAVGLVTDSIGTDFKNLKFPNILWAKEVPKYRLVLEKVEDAK